MVDTYKITISPYINDYDDEELKIEREFIQNELGIKPFTEEEIKANVQVNIIKYSLDIAKLIFNVPEVIEVTDNNDGTFEVKVKLITSYQEFELNLDREIGSTGNIVGELDFGEFTTYDIEKI